MKVTVVGVGLIGGSMILDMRRKGLVDTVWGVDSNTHNLHRAKQLRIIDDGKNLENAIKDVDLIILSVPVHDAIGLLAKILDWVAPNTLVMDVGSTKHSICNAVKNHKNRKQYIACHPIAGTEHSGPDAAREGLFKDKVNIVCNQKESDESMLKKVEELFQKLDMRTLFMDSEEHDRHIAYVSHLSHVTSFILGLTVLEVEKNENHIFNMAGSGFASTARLAKSSPSMWTAILMDNKKNIIRVIEEYGNILHRFKSAIENNDENNIRKMIEYGNEIKRILKGIELQKK